MRNTPPTSLLVLLRILLRMYPRRFREHFASAIAEDFSVVYAGRVRGGYGALQRWLFIVRTLADVARAAVKERFRPSYRRSPRSPKYHVQQPSSGAGAMQSLLYDIRYAVRSMRREPAFFGFAAVIMGLGIGASASVFSVMSPLLLRPLPFEQAERLVWVAQQAEGGMSAVTSRTSNLRDFREMNRSFEALTGYFAFFDYNSYNLVGAGEPERLVGVRVARDFLEVLGVSPVLGRNFVEEESVWQGRPAAMLTHGLWTRRFAGDPEVIGRSVTLNGTPTEIVGVLPASFDFASTFAPASHVDFLTPFPISDETDRWGSTLAIIGRLKPGVTAAGAQADLELIVQRLEQADPDRWGLGAVVTPLQNHIAGTFRGALYVLAAAAGVVLLIACANLSNLLLVRGRQRAKEMAIRSVLGAGRRTLVRQLTVESLILGVAGGFVGVLIALGATKVVARADAFDVPLLSSISVDGAALLFTFLASLAAGLLVGVIPAVQVSQGREAIVVNEASRGSSDGRRTKVLREVLVIGEVALACVLLVGGGLLLRSFLSVLDVNLGFEPRNAVVWRVDTSREFETSTELNTFYDNLISEVVQVPGVDEAGLVDTPPLGRNRSWTLQAEGVSYGPDNTPPAAYPRIVDWRYLEVMRIPLIDARFFGADDDRESAFVSIVNQTAAETLFPGQDAVGRNVQVNGRLWRVVGVVSDVRHQSLEQGSGLEVYLPFTQTSSFSTFSMIVRSRLPAASLVGPVRAALERVDATMPTGDFESLDRVVDRAISPRRFLLILLGVFAGSALFLAALGIYAVLSYSVSQRAPEIGIRMALGESTGSVRLRVVKRTLLLASIGVLIGAGGSVIASRIMQSLLFGVGPNDALTFVGMAVVLLGVSAGAGYVPALRASRTNPMEALRSA